MDTSAAARADAVRVALTAIRANIDNLQYKRIDFDTFDFTAHAIWARIANDGLGGAVSELMADEEKEATP